MRLPSTPKVALASALLGATIAPANAQSTRSELGAHARATITISASVKPTFSVSAPNDGLKISSNVSSQLRYAVVVKSEDAGTRMDVGEQHLASSGLASGSSTWAQNATSRLSGERRLVLIVPD